MKSGLRQRKRAVGRRRGLSLVEGVMLQEFQEQQSKISQPPELVDVGKRLEALAEPLDAWVSHIHSLEEDLRGLCKQQQLLRSSLSSEQDDLRNCFRTRHDELSAQVERNSEGCMREAERALRHARRAEQRQKDGSEELLRIVQSLREEDGTWRRSAEEESQALATSLRGELNAEVDSLRCCLQDDLWEEVCCMQKWFQGAGSATETGNTVTATADMPVGGVESPIELSISTDSQGHPIEHPASGILMTPDTSYSDRGLARGLAMNSQCTQHMAALLLRRRAQFAGA